jgi:hypothetical protein
MENSLANPSFHEFLPALVNDSLNQENPFNSRAAMKGPIQKLA